MTSSRSGMLPLAPIVAPSKQIRPPKRSHPMAILLFIMGLSYHQLVQAVINANSADSSVIQQQASAAVLTMLKSIQIVWAPGHCGLSGNELADQQAKLGAAETQPDNTFEPATGRALIHHSSRTLPSNTSG